MYNGIYQKEQYAYAYDTLAKWLALKIQGGSLGGYMAEKGVGRVAIYGVNGLGRQAYKDIVGSGIEIVCFLDRQAGSFCNGMDGLPVLSPQQAGQLPEGCYIMITPEYYFQEIMADLAEIGIPLGRMVSPSMFL